MHTNALGAAAGGGQELRPRIALMTRIENDFGRWGVQAEQEDNSAEKTVLTREQYKVVKLEKE